jgi:ribosomal protein S18 acetylase RimI-like enzyme
VIYIKQVEQPDEKTTITLKVMHSLLAWFSPPEDIEKKSIIHRDYPFFAAYDENEPIGFVALKIHNKYTADIFNLGILEQYHRQGIGRKLLHAAEQYCMDNGYFYLTVKTLDASAEYEPYERTRAFYQKMGFIPLEVFTTFWNEENPCLFMVKGLFSFAQPADERSTDNHQIGAQMASDIRIDKA